MAKRKGRPKGSKNKKQVDDFEIPENADIWYEVWFSDKMYGYCRKEFLAEIVTALFINKGDVKKARKSSKANYMKELKDEIPVLRKKKTYITRCF